jgi:hypothetical protein
MTTATLDELNLYHLLQRDRNAGIYTEVDDHNA